jgi:nitrate/nitrite transporter NarK
LFALVIDDNAAFIAVLCVAQFFAMACGVSGYSVAIAFGGKRVGVVFAHMNMGGNIGAAMFPMTIGWLVGWTGNWNLAIVAVAGLFAASGVCWAFLKAKGTLFDDEPPSEAMMKASETT